MDDTDGGRGGTSITISHSLLHSGKKKNGEQNYNLIR